MRLVAVGWVVALLLTAMADCTQAQGQPNCDPPRRPGGIVGRIDESVTQPIGQGNCGSQANTPAQPDSDPPCRSVRLEYRPSAIPYRHYEMPDLTYEPRYCKTPEAAANYQLLEGSADIFQLFGAGQVGIMKNVAATAKVQLRHGNLAPSVADISSTTRPEKCTAMTLSYDPPTIHVRSSGEGQLSFLPEGCLEEPGRIQDAKFISSNPSIASVYEQGRKGDLSGLRIGEATITASLPGMAPANATVKIVNDGPPCESLEVRYWTARLPVGGQTALLSRFSPSMQYFPPNCAEPETDPRFEIVTHDTASHDTASVDGATGVVTGLKLGPARIGVSHTSTKQKSLYAVANPLEIVAPLPCDDLQVWYEPPRFNLHAESTPKFRYRQTKRSDTYAEPCEKPKGEAAFSEVRDSKRPSPMVEILASGVIKGIAVGYPQIRVDHGDLNYPTSVEVLAGQECKKLIARYDPPIVAVGQRSELRLKFEPEGCVVLEPRKISHSASDGDKAGLVVSDEGTAWGQRPGGYRVKVEQGLWYEDGAVSTEVDLAVTGGCTDFAVRASPPTVEPGKDALLIFEYNPDDRCRPLEKPSLKWIKTISNDVVSEKMDPDGSLFVTGQRGGKAVVTIQPGPLGVAPDGEYIHAKTVTLSVGVAAPPCTAIAIRYKEPRFDPHQRVEPHWAGGGPAIVSYSPDKCTQPEEKRHFKSTNDKFIVNDEGKIMVHPARGRSEYAWITVTHGRDLVANIKVGKFED